MANFSIKSVFSAVDKITAPVKRMSKATSSFGKRTELAMKRAKLATNRYSAANRGMMGSLATLVGAGGLLFMVSGGLRTVVNANIEMDKSLQSLQAITGVTGSEFNSFAKEIENVSKRQLIFGADTAKAFELVGSAKPELLESAEALAKVTESAITLGKAGSMEVEGAVDSLTTALNQFGAGADEATKYVDIMATAQQKGSGTINYLSEAMIKAGGTSRAFGNSFGDTVAVLEGFAKASVKPTEAGTQWSGILSKLSTVQEKEFNPQFTKGTDIINNLAKANLSYTELIDLTDTQGAKWITTLINQNEIIQKLTGNLNVAGNAQAQADKKANSLSNRLKEVGEAFKIATTSTDSQNEGMQRLKDALLAVAENMDKIIAVVIFAGKIFLTWVGYIVMVNVALKINSALLAVGKLLKFIKVISLMVKAKGAWAAVQWALNAAMAANPVGAIVIAIIALIAVVVLLVTHWRTVWDWLNKIFDNKWVAIIGAIFLPMIAIPVLVAKNWEKVKEVLSMVWDAIKTGVKSAGLFIFDFLIAPIKLLLSLVAMIPGKVGDMAQSGLDALSDARVSIGGEEGASTLGASGTDKGQEDALPASKIYNRDYVFNQRAEERAQNANIMLNINNNNNSDISAATQGAGVNIKNTSMFK